MQNSTPQNYLSQKEASALAGVSGETLLRFAEAGYFRTFQQHGETQFSKIEICQVFGPAISSTFNAKEAQLSDSSNSVADRTLEGKEEAIGDRPSDDDKPNNSEDSPLEKSGSPRPQKDSEIANQVFQSASKLAKQVEKFIETEDPGVSHSSPVSSSGTKSSSVVEPDFSSKYNPENKSDNSDVNSTEAFKKVLQLQEELLAQNQIRISDLTKERDWLRSRLEKMEDKSDRDQMLLMVESQKVRTLIGKGNQKSSIFQTALEWFGGKSQPSNNQTNNAPD